MFYHNDDDDDNDDVNHIVVAMKRPMNCLLVFVSVF